MEPEFCIICGRLFREAQAAEEHIIPNALGGLLATKKATCSDCNSESGHTEDSALVALFGPLLSAFDVVRDRGEPRVVRFKDRKSGLEFFLKPGRQPEKSPNFRVESTETGGLRFQVSAPTEAEARAILKQYTKQDTSKLELTPDIRTTEQYTWRFQTILHDPILLRGIARIAIYFARHLGLQIGRDSPAVQYLAGRRESLGVVAPARGEVVEVHASAERALTHGIFLRCFPTDNQCYAYVVLFEYLEFVVWLGPVAESVPPTGHQVNLVSGRKVFPELTWLASPVVMRKWLRSPRINPDRVIARFQSAKFYLENPRSLWFERAMLRAHEAYFQAKNSGKSDAEADVKASEVANAILERYDMKVEQMSFEPEDRSSVRDN